MKAAVNYTAGDNPQWVDIDEPTGAAGDVVVHMKAVAIKNLDKMRAAGKHYSLSFNDGLAKMAGTDGVGLLDDGTPVYVLAKQGAFAEKVYVNKKQVVPLPEGMDMALAAALPNALMGSVLALKYRAKLEKGDNVLINGVTGITGRVSVQVAKYYGAGTITGTGRNAAALAEIKQREGVDTLLMQKDYAGFYEDIQQLHAKLPIDVVLDYLWGPPAEKVMAALKGMGKYTHATRFVNVGNMAGEDITVPSGILRSTDLVLTGSGLGSWTPAEEAEYYETILPEMFALAAKGGLNLPVETREAAKVGELWDSEPADGSRAVYML